MQMSNVSGCWMLANKCQTRGRSLQGETSFSGMLLEHPSWTHCLPVFGCDFSSGSWDSQTLSTAELCGFAVLCFGVGEGARQGREKGLGCHVGGVETEAKGALILGPSGRNDEMII